MEIIRADKRHIDGINSLLRQVLEVHHKGRPDLFKGGVKKYTDEELGEILSDDERPVFAAVEGDKVLGYAFCVLIYHEKDNILTDIKTLYIDDLCVDEAVRGTGTGKALYEYVLKFAKEKGCYNVTLNVWSCNPGAMRFYEKMGLVPRVINLNLNLK